MRAEASAARPSLPPQRQRRPAWRRIERAAVLLLFAAVLWLLLRQAREVDWPAVLAALRGMTAATLLGAAALGAASHALYGGLDLIGKRELGHAVAVPRVLAVAFVSYAFNLNFGALVGGVGLRYRLYSRLGLGAARITRVLGLSVLGNWLGYGAVAAGVLIFFPPTLPPAWPIGRVGLLWLGLGLLSVVLGYVVACFEARRRSWRWRGRELRLPSGRSAVLQLALSSTNWLIIGGVVTVLLGTLDYPSVLGVMLIAAVAGVVTHVPAGLGVLEAVFLILLSQRAAQAELLAALLAYRAIYYLAPLAVALLVLAWLETRSRRGAAPGRDEADAADATDAGT